MIGYKGFGKDFKCRDFQFEVGETYHHDDELKVCQSGFHFCDTPLAVLEFYPPTGSRFALVEANGEILQERDTRKFCTNNLTIVKELSLAELVAQLKETATNTGYCSAATNTGNYSAAVVSGSSSIAIVTGRNSKAKAALGCWLVLTEWGVDSPIDVQAFKVDGVNILPDTFYTLKGGLPVSVEEVTQ